MGATPVEHRSSATFTWGCLQKAKNVHAERLFLCPLSWPLTTLSLLAIIQLLQTLFLSMHVHIQSYTHIWYVYTSDYVVMHVRMHCMHACMHACMSVRICARTHINVLSLYLYFQTHRQPMCIYTVSHARGPSWRHLGGGLFGGPLGALYGFWMFLVPFDRLLIFAGS